MAKETDTFRALVTSETAEGRFERAIRERRIADLPPGDVLIRVLYSSLNYKDALSATGNRGVTRAYPHTPGVDAAGLVAESGHPEFAPGDEVVVTGYDLGMNTSGGFGEYVRVPAGWVVPKPEGLTLRECMIFGTAGFAATQAVTKLEAAGLRPGNGQALVTGAGGGVGGIAAAQLAMLGYEVVGATGKPEAVAHLARLGVIRTVGREEVNDDSGRPLLKARWAGAVDTVGGAVLSTVIRSVGYRGAVSACGNAGGAEMALTVYPFILRGITLFGIDSAGCPMEPRLEVWRRMATDLHVNLEAMAREITLNELSDAIDRILAGGIMGRTIIRHET